MLGRPMLFLEVSVQSPPEALQMTQFSQNLHLLLCRVLILTVHPKGGGAPSMCTGDICHSILTSLHRLLLTCILEYR